MPLNFDVFDLDFPAGSKNKSAVLVSNESEAVLIDAGFTRADGHRLVAAILDSGKKLTTVFVSHADPDFYFGLEVIADAFPAATLVATPLVIEHIRASFEGKLVAWAALGQNLPTRLVDLEPFTGDALAIGDHRVLRAALRAARKHEGESVVFVVQTQRAFGLHQHREVRRRVLQFNACAQPHGQRIGIDSCLIHTFIANACIDDRIKRQPFPNR